MFLSCLPRLSENYEFSSCNYYFWWFYLKRREGTLGNIDLRYFGDWLLGSSWGKNPWCDEILGWEEFCGQNSARFDG